MISPLEVDIGQGRIASLKSRTGEAERNQYIQKGDKSYRETSQSKGQVGCSLRTSAV